MDSLEKLIIRAEGLIGRLETLLPTGQQETDWTATAFRWLGHGNSRTLKGIASPDRIRLANLLGIEKQKKLVVRNTQQFIAGMPANNLLAWGSRGTGKSSLIKAVLNEYADQSLRLIEVDKHLLLDLPDIAQIISARPEKFILYCDDLSFEGNDPAYKSLKVVLDGSISNPSENLLIYATSNRRHLLPEYMADNQAVTDQKGEIHFAEVVEEKLALSDRFGLWLSFPPFDQDQYLQIVQHWLHEMHQDKLDSAELREEALRWALRRGSRSGRTAWQFAKDWAGSNALHQQQTGNASR